MKYWRAWMFAWILFACLCADFPIRICLEGLHADSATTTLVVIGFNIFFTRYPMKLAG